MTNSTPGKFAVATGVSSGIGLELALQFAQNGFDLLIVSETNRIHQAAQALSGLGAQVSAVQADLATYDGVEQFYREIRIPGRAVDAIAINAGVGVSGDLSRQTGLADELNMIGLNVAAPVHIAKRVLKDMLVGRRDDACSF